MWGIVWPAQGSSQTGRLWRCVSDLPTAVSAKIYMRFKPAVLHQSMPLLRGMTEYGTPYLLNSRQYGEWVVVDELAPRLELRRGAGELAERVVVTREQLRVDQLPRRGSLPPVARQPHALNEEPPHKKGTHHGAAQSRTRSRTGHMDTASHRESHQPPRQTNSRRSPRTLRTSAPSKTRCTTAQAIFGILLTWEEHCSKATRHTKP